MFLLYFLELVHVRETAEILSEEIQSLPDFYWKAKPERKPVKRCAKLPSLSDLHFSNLFWQDLVINQTTFSLFSAHLDTREEEVMVRVLGMVNTTLMLFCQLWYDYANHPVSAVVKYHHIWPPRWGETQQTNMSQVGHPPPSPAHNIFSGFIVRSKFQGQIFGITNFWVIKNLVKKGGI